MRIGILTMPLKTNYGGILQAYALQTVLKHNGNDVEIISRCYPRIDNRILGKFKEAVLILLNRIRGVESTKLSNKEYRLVSAKTEQFINKYINRSKLIYTTTGIKDYSEGKGFEAYIVGSDQIWRPRYCPSIEDYYLGFTEQQSVKRIAYAASFGVDEWEYSKDETEMCSRLVKRFDAVGVREDSGVDLCSRFLGVTAQHVLDPTMLLSKTDYEKIAVDAELSKGNMFCYILDHGVKKDSLIKDVSLQTKKTPFECMPKGPLYHGKIRGNLGNCVFPAPAQWIRSFMDAELVVTDSFHGAVFSIIFNKPFWVIGNRTRGLARMESLLKMFGLSERFIDIDNDSHLKRDWFEPINWDNVNQRLVEWRDISMSFINKALS